MEKWLTAKTRLSLIWSAVLLSFVIASLLESGSSTDRAWGLPVPKPDIHTSPCGLLGPSFAGRGASTAAQPTLAVISALFDCSKEFCNHFHDRCTLKICYSLQPAEESAIEPRPTVICKARVSYHTEDGDLFYTEAESTLQYSDTSPYADDKSNATINFHFSYYEGVVKAQLDGVECRMDRTNSSKFSLPMSPLLPKNITPGIPVFV